MTDTTTRRPKPPPTWFVHGAWRVHRVLYRLSGGRFLWTPASRRGWGALHLTTVGRRTGRERGVIVGYLEDGPNLVTLAMNGWEEGHPAWWLNLEAHPDAVVRVAHQAPRPVRARLAAGAERDRLKRRWVQIDPDHDSYAERRSTETLVVVLEPAQADGSSVLGVKAAADASAGDPGSRGVMPARPGPALTTDDVWKEVEKATFVVLSHVTSAGEPRSSGVMYGVAGGAMFVVVAADSWKARQIADGDEVALTVPVRRGGLLSLVAPIPPATVSFRAAVVRHAPGAVPVTALPPRMAKALPPARREGVVVLELHPAGTFLTYGLGVSLTAMRDPARSRARVPIRGADRRGTSGGP